MDDTSIRLDSDIRDRLKERGKKGESYSDIINKLLGPYICGRCLKSMEWNEVAVEIGDGRGEQLHGVMPHDLSGYLCRSCANDYDVDIYEALYGTKPETEANETA